MNDPSAFPTEIGKNNAFNLDTMHKKKKYYFIKICDKDRKYNIFVSFRMFPFHKNIIFSELSFKRKCKEAASFHKCIFLSKYEIFVYDSCS